MEILFGILLFGVILFIVKSGSRDSSDPDHSQKHSARRKTYTAPPKTPPVPPKTTKAPTKKPARPRANMPEIEGPARIVDGDTLIIKKVNVRLYGVDAPELNHPYGQKAKWALVGLCKGHHVRVKIIEQDTHGRAVGMCYLPDGRDLSEEMVKIGLALDWPKYSEGDYRMFEPPGVRKKLWLAAARQKGHMHVWEKFEARQKVSAATQAK